MATWEKQISQVCTTPTIEARLKDVSTCQCHVDTGYAIYAAIAYISVLSDPIQWWQVNIVDTPGHADFGAEVERILNMVSS